MEITKQDLERVHQKFIQDPDWRVIETLIEQFIEPLKSIDNIDTTGKTSDEVFAELQGRKMTYKALNDFLNEMRLIKIGVTKKESDNTFR